MANVPVSLPLFFRACPGCLRQRYSVFGRTRSIGKFIRRSVSQEQHQDGHQGSQPNSNFDEDSDQSIDMKPLDREDANSLYSTHIPTTALQKSLLIVGSAVTSLLSPWRGDMVATLGETTGYYALVTMRQKMLADETGRQILDEKPVINTTTVDLEYLQQLPEGTFGKVYATWLEKNKASPDERLPVHFVDDPDLAYVMRRYREIHDLFHTTLGMPTNMLGEIVVKWVEAIQLGLPMCGLGAMFGPLRLGPKHRQMYLQTHLWWAIRTGRQARFLMNVYYEKHWDWPLEEFRSFLNIDAPPKTPQRKHKST